MVCRSNAITTSEVDGRCSFISDFLTAPSRCMDRPVRKRKRPSGIGKKVSFVWSVNRIGRIVFWSCFEGLVGFVHSKRELVVEILFFFFPNYLAKREKTKLERRSRHGLDFFSPGESVKTKRLKCIFLGNVFEVSKDSFFSLYLSLYTE